MVAPPADSWSYPIQRQDIPEQGLHVRLEAEESVRAGLAQAAQLRGLPRVSAVFDLTCRPGGAIHVSGEVSATVVQDCVVTLEPIEQTLAEPIEVTFVPAAASPDEGAAELKVTDTDTVEPLAGAQVDLGAIATEYFLLGIDPYPRKEGVTFENPVPVEPAESPFAALAALKKRDPGTA